MINQQQLSSALALIAEAKAKIVEAELLLTSETGLHAAIEKPEKDLNFLAEINEPVEQLKTVFDLEPEIPSMEGIEPIGKAEFVFRDDYELVQTSDDRYGKLVAWLINGGTIDALIAGMESRKIQFKPKVFDHLKNLIWYRQEILKGVDGAFDLKSILTQNDTTEFEKPLWRVVAKQLK